MLLLLGFLDATSFRSASTLFLHKNVHPCSQRQCRNLLCTSWRVGKALAVNNELNLLLSFRAGRLILLLTRSDSFFLKYGNLVPCLSRLMLSLGDLHWRVQKRKVVRSRALQ
ncbi:unnamed protein product [Ixodes pacificus]